MISLTSLDKIYKSEISHEIGKFKDMPVDVVTERSIAHLPEPVKKHFRVCGFMGRPETKNAVITWENVKIKLGRNSKWLKLRCRQFNSTIEPSRIVLMQSRIAGIIPFAGRDKFQDGHGNMYIRLMGFLTVGDEKGEKMDQSALVTVLAETFLAPSQALRKYIEWESIDGTKAKATINWRGVRAAGIFHFNESGEFTQFVTDDRWQYQKDEKTVRWRAVASDYKERNGIRFPGYLRAAWDDRDGEFEYFRGEIENLKINVDEYDK